MNYETISLGQHLTTYRPKHPPSRILLIAGGISLLIALIMLGSAAGKLFGNADLGSSFVRDRLLINAILGLFAFVLTAVFGALYYTQMKNRVDLYAGGFVHTDWRKSLTIRWEDVTEVYEMPMYYRRTGAVDYHSRHIINYLYTVKRGDGHVAKFGGLENIAQLGKAIEAASNNLIWPRVVKTFDAGGNVSFGSQLSISQKGVKYGNSSLFWTDVADVRVDSNNDVAILQKDKRMPWKVIAGNKIANPSILKMLIGKIKDEGGIDA